MPNIGRRFAIGDRIKCNYSDRKGVIRCFASGVDTGHNEAGVEIDDPLNTFRGHDLEMFPGMTKGWYFHRDDIALITPSENRIECNDFAPQEVEQEEEYYEEEEEEREQDWEEMDSCTCERCTAARAERGEI